MPWNEPIYQVADEFRQRCLIDGRSLLWPGHSAWTLDNLHGFWAAFVGHPDDSGNSFIDKWRDQLSNQPDDVIRIAVDISALYGLFPARTSMRPSTKRDLVIQIRNFRPRIEDPDNTTWDQLLEAFEQRGVGSTGTHYSTGRPYHMAFYLGFAIHLKENNIDPYDWHGCRDAADVARQRVKTEYGQTPSLSRNILLHLLFPEYFEDTASDDQKRRMLNAFAVDAGVREDSDVDEGILAIREHLGHELGTKEISFYSPDIRSRWDSSYSAPNPIDGSHPTRSSPDPEASDTARLSQTVFHSETFLEEIDDLLQSKHQLIFEGPPGSGKTYVAEKFARWFTGQALDGEPLNERVEVVQFHQSYGYEDFVQGIRPETNDDGQLVYQVRDGIFLDMCERAKSNPEERFVLIIDEINRGNLSRIFGELLLLLEYRNQSVRLPYGSGDAAYLTIPENLYLIGTMNTADRSLAQIDYALRRRFYFVRFMPVEDGKAGVFANWLAANERIGDSEKRRLLRLFINLNEGIREHLHTDDLQVGHSYFMQPGIETPVVFNRVWRRAVRPLLEEYLHHHRNRDDILAALTPDALVTPGSETHEAVDGNQSKDDSAPEP